MRVTDEMVEAAARAVARATYVEPLGGNDDAVFISASSSEWCRKVARAALEAALAVEGTPKVKALEWKKDWRGDLDDIPTWRAETPVGRLSFSVHGYASHDAAPIERTDAAKAEIQADYEKRVLSCLEYTTPPAGIRGALEEQYVVWSHKHSAWWRPNCAGYAQRLEDAGVYSRDDALCISHKGRDGWLLDEAPDELPIRLTDLPDWALAALRGQS